ncbi:HNH endonuclease [Pedobacter deserti]|uniref:HNH endonuclease n=1 Tax=Pedobacter deserti TaxID=2817382 RepID=UPI00210CAFD7|nr:HNH endonuclease [Pedobacter sp. SYSU D00382]
MRNPKWHRDEIILALDLYFKLDAGNVHSKNQQILDLSKFLNKLPIHPNKPDDNKFRNPNGVSLKLSNFLSIDGNYAGKGMSSSSKLDREIFEEFKNDRIRLSQIATSIKAAVTDSILRESVALVSDEQEENVKEGQILYRLHKFRERDRKIIERKKASSLKRFGRLECEVCEFDFYEKYGTMGYGFIECHHKVPLYSLSSVTETRTDDLALVCANCHRMLHRSGSLNLETLKTAIELLRCR